MTPANIHTAEITTEDRRQLPKSWRWARLGDVCKQDRRILGPVSSEAMALLYLSLEDVESNTGRILKKSSDGVNGEGKSTTFAFDTRHVLYGKLRPYLNKVAIPDFAGRCTTEMIPLLPADSIDRNFLGWILRRQESVAAALRGKTGSRMPRADMDDLLDLEIPLPPVAEQKHIVTILAHQMSTVQHAHAATEAQSEAAKSLPMSCFHTVFESQKAKQWATRRIGTLSETCSGSTPSRSREDYFGGKIPWVKTAELLDRDIVDSEEHITETAMKECNLRLLPKGSLLVAMYGQGQTRGRTGILSKPATTNQACFAILPNEVLFEPKFIQFWFRHNYQKIRRNSEGRGGNQPNLNGLLIRDMEIALPNLLEQRTIIGELEHRIALAEQTRNLLGEKILAIDRMPAALLRRAFSGEL